MRGEEQYRKLGIFEFTANGKKRVTSLHVGNKGCALNLAAESRSRIVLTSGIQKTEAQRNAKKTSLSRPQKQPKMLQKSSILSDVTGLGTPPITTALS
jgi:hypothetical protein